jgi:hypothetical protein
LQEFLLVDPLARQAAVALPAAPSLEQVDFLVSIGLQLGRSLPAAPVLWPLLVTYKPGAAIEPGRLQGRNVLLLGALFQWGPALPADAAPALVLESPEADSLLVQGRRQKRAELDSTLSFAQLLSSPWSATNVVVCVGGWRDYAIPSSRRMLFDPASPLVLLGNLGAMDELGRGAAMDLGESGPSFVERVKNRLSPPAGANAGAKPIRAESVSLRVRRSNRGLSMTCGTVLVLLVAIRLGLTWQQTRLRKAALERERRAGGIP